MRVITFEAATPRAYPAPEPAAKHIPEWFKKLPVSVSGNPKKDKHVVVSSDGYLESHKSMKNCVPVLDYLTTGYIIPLWSDIAVEQREKELYFNWQRSMTEETLQFHAPQQVIGTPFAHRENGAALPKLISPWRIKTTSGYSCLFFSPHYTKSNIEILPAVVDTDKYHEVNFPFVYHREPGQQYHTLERGTPVVQVLPFKREEWNHSVREEDASERENFKMLMQTVLFKAYRKLFHSPKKYR